MCVCVRLGVYIISMFDTAHSCMHRIHLQTLFMGRAGLDGEESSILTSSENEPAASGSDKATTTVRSTAGVAMIMMT